MALVGWLHIKLFQWVVVPLVRLAGTLFIKIPVQAVTRLVTAVVAWMHIMVRLWVGVAVGGILAFLLASVMVKLSPPGSNWRLVALLVILVWLLVLFRAAQFTVEWFDLRKVRQSQAFREVHQGVRKLQEDVGGLKETAANVTWGTPLERISKRNRDRGDREAAEETRAARAEAAAERERMDEERKVMAERAAGYDPDDGF